jgi:hypothetical protein
MRVFLPPLYLIVSISVSATGEVRPVFLNQASRPSQSMSKSSQDKLRHTEFVETDSCNLTSSDKPLYIIPRKKIIRGKEASAGEVPYQIVILNTFGDLVCGGTIFNKQTIVTASHVILLDLLLSEFSKESGCTLMHCTY